MARSFRLFSGDFALSVICESDEERDTPNYDIVAFNKFGCGNRNLAQTAQINLFSGDSDNNSSCNDLNFVRNAFELYGDDIESQI